MCQCERKAVLCCNLVMLQLSHRANVNAICLLTACHPGADGAAAATIEPSHHDFCCAWFSGARPCKPQRAVRWPALSPTTATGARAAHQLSAPAATQTGSAWWRRPGRTGTTKGSLCLHSCSQVHVFSKRRTALEGRRAGHIQAGGCANPPAQISSKRCPAPCAPHPPQMLLCMHQAMPAVRLRGPFSTGKGVGCPGLNSATSGELRRVVRDGQRRATCGISTFSETRSKHRCSDSISAWLEPQPPLHQQNSKILPT